MTYNQLQPQCLHNFCSVASPSRLLCCKIHWLLNVCLDVVFPSDVKNTPESWVGVIPWGCLWTRSLKAVISFLLVWLLCTNSIFLFPACFSSCPFRCTGFRILSVSLVHKLHWFEIWVNCFCSPNMKKQYWIKQLLGLQYGCSHLPCVYYYWCMWLLTLFYGGSKQV